MSSGRILGRINPSHNGYATLSHSIDMPPIQESDRDALLYQPKATPKLTSDYDSDDDLIHPMHQSKKTAFERFVKEPFVTSMPTVDHLKENWPYDILALLSSIPGAIFAFCVLTGIKSEDILSAMVAMSFLNLTGSFSLALNSLMLNTKMNVLFYKNFRQDLIAARDKWKQDRFGKALISAATFTGLSASFAAAKLGADSFAWSNPAIAILVGILNLINVFCTRFNGTIKLISAARPSAQQQFENDCVKTLDMLSPAGRTYFNDLLAGKELNEKTIEELFTELDKNLNNPLFWKSEFREKIKNWSLFSLKFIPALVFAAYIFVTFNQKSYQGMEQWIEWIASFMVDKPIMSGLNDFTKAMIGTIPGLSHAIFYGKVIFDLPSLLVNQTLPNLRQNPGNIAPFVITTGLAGASGSSVYEIAESVNDDAAKRFMPIPPQVEVVSGTAAALLNEKVLLQQNYPAPSLQTAQANIKTIKSHIQTQHLSNARSGNIKKLSMFQPKSKAKDSGSHALQGSGLRPSFA